MYLVAYVIVSSTVFGYCTLASVAVIQIFVKQPDGVVVYRSIKACFKVV